MATLFAAGLAFAAANGIWTARQNEVSVSTLALYYDGSQYLAIAKSFPLPYSLEGTDYAGRPPLYPAAIYLARLLIPRGVADWGEVAIGVAWLCAALTLPAFYALCRAAGVRPALPVLLFALANPTWIRVSATSHSEPLGVLLLIGSLTACFRGSMGRCLLLLALATLTRYQALILLAPLALSPWLLRDRSRLRAAGLLCLPVAALAAFNLYLFLRIPGFRGVWEAQHVFWDVRLTFPFESLIRHAPLFWSQAPAFGLLVYGSLVAYLAAIWIGLRPPWGASGRTLALFVAVIVGFQVSLSEILSVQDFTRYSLLAWPPAALLLGRWLGERAPAAALVGICLVLGGIGLRHTSVHAALAMAAQGIPPADVLESAASSDEPLWVDFGEPGRARFRWR